MVDVNPDRRRSENIQAYPSRVRQFVDKRNAAVLNGLMQVFSMFKDVVKHPLAQSVEDYGKKAKGREAMREMAENERQLDYQRLDKKGNLPIGVGEKGITRIPHNQKDIFKELFPNSDHK